MSAAAVLTVSEPLPSPGPSASGGSARRGVAWRTAVTYLVTAVLIGVPCFWQPHIQANDLSSHLYNAWLVNQVEAGQLKGLYVVRQFTNVLFDRLLSFLLLKTGSVVATERIAVLAAVQIFFWGSFMLASTVARRRAWSVAPFLALLSYGAVFRMGFFNFYISVGLCTVAIALAWRNRRRRLLAIPVLGLAYTAHMLPVIWALGAIAYVMVARRLGPPRRPWLCAVGLAGIAAVALFLAKFVPSRWPPSLFIGSLFGVDQVLTFGMKYQFVAAGLLSLWILLLIRRLIMRAALRDSAFQLWVLSAAGCVLMPMSISLPFYRAGMTYVTIHVSLLSAVVLCSVIARVRFNRLEKLISFALVALYLSFAFVDERALNSAEHKINIAVATLPSGSRILATLKDSRLYVPALEHMLDRQCIGRCFDFANYEPAATQFRLRALPGNTYVMTDIGDVSRLEHNEYFWNRQDIKVMRLTSCGDNRQVCLTEVRQGETLLKTQLDSVPQWWTTGSSVH
jgi:hypothetical protein